MMPEYHNDVEPCPKTTEIHLLIATSLLSLPLPLLCLLLCTDLTSSDHNRLGSLNERHQKPKEEPITSSMLSA